MVKSQRGRPPVGPGGEKRTEMRQMTARIPDADYRLLRALAAVLHTSQAGVVSRALAALKATLPPHVQKVVQLLAKSQNS